MNSKIVDCNGRGAPNVSFVYLFYILYCLYYFPYLLKQQYFLDCGTLKSLNIFHISYFIFRLLQKFIWIVLLTFLHSVQQPVVFERINWLENQCMLAKEYMITLLLIMRFSTISKFVYFWNPWWYSIIAIEFFWKKRLAGGIIYFHRTNQGSFNI